MGDAKLIDMMLGALHDPFHTIHMGVTAENVAKEYDISRAQQDEAALNRTAALRRRSRRATSRTRSSPSPLSRKGDIQFDTDEHVRHDATWTT